MRYLSLCSGIEAATVAWHSLGWTPVAFAEIEAFPSAVLAHHYPTVRNLGDMTRFREWPEKVFLEADLIVAGTPCQAFSVAGLRGSLTDARGNLTLILIHLLNHAAQIRHHAGRPAPLLVWENVPGVLSTDDNAFGRFLGGLAGEDDPLTPPGPKWTDAGFVSGPQRAIAWRLLDAQYFGLAQRRERVFLVASPADGTGPDPAQVLFEHDRLRRDTPPRRQTGQNPDPGFETGPSGSRFTDLAPTLDTRCKDGPIRNQLGIGVITPPLTTSAHADNLSEEGKLIPEATHALTGEGFDASEDGTGRGTPIIPEAYGGNNTSGPIEIATAVRANPQPHFDFASETFLVGPGPLATDLYNGTIEGDTAPTLGARGSHSSAAGPTVAVPIAFPERLSATQVASTEDLSPNLQARNPTAVAFSTRSRGDDGRGYDRPPLVFGDICGALETVKPHCVAFSLRGREGGAMPEADPDNLAVQRAASGGSSRSYIAQEVLSFRACGQDGFTPADLAPPICASDGGGCGVPSVATFQQSSLAGKGTLGYDSSGLAKPCKTQSDGQMIHAGYQVRRLTPTECERLQGFPDGYTLIPWRNKPADQCPDGPRYKALGNSKAVPAVRWIGRRIEQVLNNRTQPPPIPQSGTNDGAAVPQQPPTPLSS